MKLKGYIIIGAIFGGIMSLSISILMDTIYGDSLQGTWRDAILSLFGSFMGVLFTFIIYKFFNLLHETENKEYERLPQNFYNRQDY